MKYLDSVFGKLKGYVQFSLIAPAIISILLTWGNRHPLGVYAVIGLIVQYIIISVLAFMLFSSFKTDFYIMNDPPPDVFDNVSAAISKMFLLLLLTEGTATALCAGFPQYFIAYEVAVYFVFALYCKNILYAYRKEVSQTISEIEKRAENILRYSLAPLRLTIYKLRNVEFPTMYLAFKKKGVDFHKGYEFDISNLLVVSTFAAQDCVLIVYAGKSTGLDLGATIPITEIYTANLYEVHNQNTIGFYALWCFAMVKYSNL